MTSRRVIVLGSTGSVGVQTLRVIDHLNQLADRGHADARYDVVGLAARSNATLLAEQASRWPEANIALAEPGANAPRAKTSTLYTGPDAAERLVTETDADLVVAAIVGFAGLNATLAALDAGRDVAFANKETLVAAGPLVVQAAQRAGGRLRPVDSEHAAAWLALRTITGDASPPFAAPAELRRLVITASGGPFRLWPAEEIAEATPAEALRHPTWSMGPKVTIDSASLMNKALEVIEAHHLFGLDAHRIGVAVHPHSLAHAVAELIDGSSVAQLAPADMCIPIQQALTWPARFPGMVEPLDTTGLAGIQFEPPDLDRFPALGLGWTVIERGGSAGAIVNAANEVCVEAFLDPDGPRVSFRGLSAIPADALDAVGVSPLRSLDDVLEADRDARSYAESRIQSRLR